jgi:Carboxypeptidase regulatory-like domain
MRRMFFVCALVAGASLVAAAQQTSRPRPQQPGSQQPARDTSAQSKDTPPPTGRITGRVVTADTGKPVKRARVFVTAAELPGGRGVLTDDAGVFDLTELPAGRYSLTVSKSGFVSLAYGQRRPLQAGTPLQLGDGEQLKGVDFHLPRGGVISGRVTDEDGEPVPGAMVRILRYQYLQGDRRLTPAGTAQTDDRGQYRVWGLLPGDYYVNALTRLPGFGGRAFGPGAAPGGPGGGGRGGRGGPSGPGGDVGAMVAAVAGGNVAALFGGGDDQDAVNYAPTYYPSATSVNDARAVTVGVSQEVADINVGLQLVRTARIAGRVVNPDGTPSTNGNVNLMADGASGAAGRIGMTYGGRILRDGSFTIANVPPGRYMLRARGDTSDTPLFGTMALSVDGSDMGDVAVVLSAGATITGTVTFQPGSNPAPEITQVRIGAPSTDQTAFGPQANARVDKDGRFTLTGVSTGPHLIRPNGNTRGWMLKSVAMDGRDVTDTPIDVRAGQTLTNVAVVFTDKLTEVNGTITTQSGTPVPDYTVLAFATDPALWRPQARQIMTTRPDQTGKYRIRGLPPGDYYIAPVDPAEQGEWFDPTYLDAHRAGAARVTLAEGDVKTQDFHVIIR